jgi:AraC-like DNA-binding protein
VHELLLAAAQFGPEYDEGSAEQRLLRVILDRLPTLSLPPLHLPEPEDDRLRHITGILSKEPSNKKSLSELAHFAALTERNAERLFRSETGMTFGKWRQQLRLITALQKLADGESVTNVALDVGYSDVSAFIAMFKTILGITPAQYFRKINKHRELTTDLLQSPENIPTLDDKNVSVTEEATTRYRQGEVALPDDSVLGTQ